MPIKQNLMGVGIAPRAAAHIVGESTALTATGSSQGTALLLGGAFNYIATTGSSTGVQLPNCDPGDSIVVANAGNSTLSVYGQTGDAIDGGSVNAAFSVATNTTAIFYRITSTAWAALLSA